MMTASLLLRRPVGRRLPARAPAPGAARFPRRGAWRLLDLERGIAPVATRVPRRSYATEYCNAAAARGAD